MRKYILIILVFLLIFLYLNIDTKATRVEKTVEENIILFGASSIVLKNVTGQIHIFSWNKQKIKIIAVKSVSKWGISYPEKFLDKIKINLFKSPDSVRIYTKYPLFHWHKNARVDYRLWIPEDSTINLESIYGDIHILAALSSITARTDSGDIFLYLTENVSCCLDVNSVSGEIYNDFSTITGTVEKRRIQGKISQGKDNIEIKTNSGNISLSKL